MNKEFYMYNDTQFEEIEKFTEEKFGSHYDYLVHEIESEYIHTDIFLLKSNDGQKSFVTCGMGSRQMNTPNNFKRCELVMCASSKFVSTSEKGIILSSELVKVSKFPFREDTWLGTGHTIDVSKEFKEAFGYDYLAFLKLPFNVKLAGIDDKINFLAVIPIYEAEREWCVENHTLAFLDKLHDKYAGRELLLDFKREVFIPDDLDEEELAEYNVMTVLGIDKQTLERLGEFLEEQEQKGIDISYEIISEWMKENN